MTTLKIEVELDETGAVQRVTVDGTDLDLAYYGNGGRGWQVHLGEEHRLALGEEIVDIEEEQ